MFTGLTDAVQSVDGDRFKGASHHGVLLEDLVEVVNGQGEEAAVGVCTHACRPSALGEQTDLCNRGNKGRRCQNNSVGISQNRYYSGERHKGSHATN